MDIKRSTKSTAKMLVNFLTFEAVKTIAEQLEETDKLKALWFNQFSTRERLQNGELYIKDLFAVHQEMAFRVMTVREHLANEILDFLPELTRTSIQESNMQLRRQHFEKIMSVQASEGYAECENLEPSLEASSGANLEVPLEVVTNLDSDSVVEGDRPSPQPNQ
ncbi:chaperonin family protein RbcX [Pseudanabaena sp. FACHB-1277]|uniref:Chaperonin family protein RbcX n=1 Tax=Pseudanabaena cinerea FACHB-1277 TaxID=2949581 RepID=A0A926Z841_9CYAN|nr:chaperonin family protein RbcX [Pseudanabaena cinerea]MBD2150649.1 chaperonin family protein RbcX [Pseudanabaena cinerea FACHB-1277]